MSELCTCLSVRYLLVFTVWLLREIILLNSQAVSYCWAMVEWEQLSFTFNKDQFRPSDLTYISPTDSNLQTGRVLKNTSSFCVKRNRSSKLTVHQFWLSCFYKPTSNFLHLLLCGELLSKSSNNDSIIYCQGGLPYLSGNGRSSSGVSSSKRLHGCGLRNTF